MTSPPSAAGHLEPYGARVRLRPGSAPLEAPVFLKDLLERVAVACVDAGATVIGHLKCVLHAEAGPLACNLTSVRSGATCRGGERATVARDEDALLDIAVLVYGLAGEAIDELVVEALHGLLDHAGVDWYQNNVAKRQHA